MTQEGANAHTHLSLYRDIYFFVSLVPPHNYST